MSKQSTLYSQLDDITKCPICLDAFEDPRQLPCIHTFCSKCMEAHCKDQDPGEKVACPVCVTSFTVPPKGIQDLPKNFVMNQLLEVNKGTRTIEENKPKGMPVCEICSSCDSSTTVTATRFCNDCDQYSCERCSAAHHKQQVFQCHRIVNVFDKMSEKGIEELLTIEVYCEKHSDEIISIYCNTCKLQICGMCRVASAHSKHDCISIKNFAQNIVDQMTEDIKDVSAYAAWNQEKIEQVETNKENFMKSLETIHLDISHKSDDLRSLTRTYENELLQELNEFKCNKMKELEERKKEFERQLVITETFNKYCMDVKGTRNPVTISRIGNDLHSRAVNILSFQARLDRFELDNPPKFLSSETVEVSKSLRSLFGKLLLKDAVTTKKTNTDCTSLVNHPRVISDISTRGHITGLALLGSSLFVVGETPEIDVYDTDTLTLSHTLTIANSTNLHRIVACSHYNCLYIRDRGLKVFHRYSLPDNKFTRWSINGKCYGLSVTRNFNLLATFWDTNRLKEYTTDGSLIREILLRDGIEYPLHSVQLSDESFVVSHEGKRHRVCIVDNGGRLIENYGGSPGPGVGELNKPRQTAIDRHGHVLIADSENNRVQLLSPLLEHLGYVNISGPSSKGPRALYFDELNHRLYIGEYNGRLVVLDVVN